MKIIKLSEKQFTNYASKHSQRNFGQTVEYTFLQENSNIQKIFLGLSDSENNILAASLILIKHISSFISIAYAPDGFLIDYQNFSLVETFTEELKKYLNTENVAALILDPMFQIRTYDKNNKLIANNQNILDNLKKLNYNDVGYKSDFEKYDIIIENNISSANIYHNFNRNTKRNIKSCKNMGIILSKGNDKDLDIFYDIIKKKTNNNLSYYKNLISSFKTKDNKVELFFAKINPYKYLTMSKKLYEKEKAKNESIHNNISLRLGKMTEKALNKKITSDTLLEKYTQNLNNAIKLNQTSNEDIIIGTALIVRNNREIYFLIDGYNENYRSIHSTHILKWAIIKKYYTLGYHKFNLGEIHKDYSKKDNKYYGQYLYKIGFGGNVVEYPPHLRLIINKYKYSLYNSFKKK